MRRSAEYEAKLKRRQEREEAAKKVGGRPPKEPEAGPKEKDLTESRIIGEFILNAQAVVRTSPVSQATNDKQEVEPAAETERGGGNRDTWPLGGMRVPQGIPNL